MIYQNRTEYLSVKITKNNCYPAHMHHQIEIFYVLDGIIEITIAGQKKQMKKGMTSIAFPNMVHATHTLEHSSAIMMIFNDDLLSDFYNEFHMQKPSSPFITQLQDPEQFYFQVSKFLEQVQKNTDIRFSKGYLYLIVSMILSQVTLVKQDAVSAGICQDISNYLNLHFTEELNLSQLADALGYSKYHISHIFKENFGCSYNDYLKRIRSEHAMGLLSHSDMTATEICFASGFSSLRSFYRAFREIYGVTPHSIHS